MALVVSARYRNYRRWVRGPLSLCPLGKLRKAEGTIGTNASFPQPPLERCYYRLGLGRQHILRLRNCMAANGSGHVFRYFESDGRTVAVESGWLVHRAWRNRWRLLCESYREAEVSVFRNAVYWRNLLCM